MQHFLYVLLCNQKTYYVGITDNLERRLKEHKSKKTFYTKQFSDVELIYSEKVRNKITAEKREKQIKGWSNAKKKALIEGNIEKLIKLSNGTESVGVLE
jgi:putative endonuclease